MKNKKEGTSKDEQKDEQKQAPRQMLTIEYSGMVIQVPIILTNVAARDLELQKRAIMNAAEDAFFEYLYVNRLGRYSMIPKDEEKNEKA